MTTKFHLPYLSICLPCSTGEGVLLLNVTGYGSVGSFLTISTGLDGFSCLASKKYIS